MQRNRESVRISPRKYKIADLPTRYFNPGELEVLLHLFESVSPKVVVEFGVNTGRNAVAAIRNIPSITRYVGVDVPPTYRTIMPCQRREIPANPGALAAGLAEFELILRPNGTFDLAADDLPECDAVFIDADHSRKGVLNDRALALQIVRPGGIIIYHDDNCLDAVEVTQTLNTLCEGGAEITHVEDTWLSFEIVPEPEDGDN